MEPTAAKHEIRYKAFTYQTQVEWAGNRAGLLKSPDKMMFRVASPPEFKGEAGVWTPEDLLVAAVNVCEMTTFLAYAFRKNLPLISYASSADGRLEMVNGKYMFTKITVRPSIIVKSIDAVGEAFLILEEARRNCLISNSLQSEIIMEPFIEAEELSIAQ